MIAAVPLLLALIAAPKPAKLGWDQVAPTQQIAQGYIYRFFTDRNAGARLTGVTCGPGKSSTEFLCTAPFPPLVPGAHTIVITAGDGQANSAKSNLLKFEIVVK